MTQIPKLHTVLPKFKLDHRFNKSNACFCSEVERVSLVGVDEGEEVLVEEEEEERADWMHLALARRMLFIGKTIGRRRISIVYKIHPVPRWHHSYLSRTAACDAVLHTRPYSAPNSLVRIVTGVNANPIPAVTLNQTLYGFPLIPD